MPTVIPIINNNITYSAIINTYQQNNSDLKPQKMGSCSSDMIETTYMQQTANQLMGSNSMMNPTKAGHKVGRTMPNSGRLKGFIYLDKIGYRAVHKLFVSLKHVGVFH